MVRSLGAQIGLLAFGIALAAGLWTGNSTNVVLVRALVALLAGAVLGQLAGWGAKLVVRDHLQRKKLEIDRHHFAEIRTLSGSEEAPPAAPGDGG
jgi:hypothetical protein